MTFGLQIYFIIHLYEGDDHDLTSADKLITLDRGSMDPNYPNFPCQHKNVSNLVYQTTWTYPNPTGIKVNLRHH